MDGPESYQRPFLALLDDDPESARLLTMMLLAHGAPSVRWLESTDQARAGLASLLAARDLLPELVIVNLKTSPEASATSIKVIRAVPGGHALVLAAMTSAPERRLQEIQLAAGADVVFERVAGDNGYRQMAARIVRYWVRSQRLDAVGA